MDTTKVRWPDAHAPEGASIYAANHTRTTADPELIWAWLIRPDQWHRFYGNAKLIRHRSGPWPQLGLGSCFSWITFGPGDHRGHRVRTLRRLAWAGRGLGATAYHVWLLDGDGPEWEIVTEETERGFLPTLARPWLSGDAAQHQRWIEQLTRLAESGERPRIR